MKAQADLLSQQQNAKDTTALEKLQDTEGKAATEYNQKAAEKYSDAKTQDRLLIAIRQDDECEGARVTAQTQTQLSLLNAQMGVRKAEQAVAEGAEGPGRCCRRAATCSNRPRPNGQ